MTRQPAVPCVRTARGEAVPDPSFGRGEEGGENGEGSEDSEDDQPMQLSPPFVGLTFPDEPPLCVVPSRGGSADGGAGSLLDSDSKVGHGSGVLLGDGGAEAFAEDVSAGEPPEAMAPASDADGEVATATETEQ